MLASWRGTRFEVGQVLREVCDRVLRDPEATEDVLVKRAKAILLTGALFKATQPDESTEERRELERLVAEAANSGKRKKDRKDKPIHGLHVRHGQQRGTSPDPTSAAATTATPAAGSSTMPPDSGPDLKNSSSGWFKK